MFPSFIPKHKVFNQPSVLKRNYLSLMSRENNVNNVVQLNSEYSINNPDSLQTSHLALHKTDFPNASTLIKN